MSVWRKRLLSDLPILRISRRIVLSSPPEADTLLRLDVWSLTLWQNEFPTSLFSVRTPLCQKVSGCHSSRLGWDGTRERAAVIAVVLLTFFFFCKDDVVKGLWFNCWSPTISHNKGRDHERTILISRWATEQNAMKMDCDWNFICLVCCWYKMQFDAPLTLW